MFFHESISYLVLNRYFCAHWPGWKRLKASLTPTWSSETLYWTPWQMELFLVGKLLLKPVWGPFSDFTEWYHPSCWAKTDPRLHLIGRGPDEIWILIKGQYQADESNTSHAGKKKRYRDRPTVTERQIKWRESTVHLISSQRSKQRERL